MVVTEKTDSLLAAVDMTIHDGPLPGPSACRAWRE